MANITREYVNPDHAGIVNSNNGIIREAVVTIINEALHHFSTTRRPRKYNDEDNRYMYHQEEVDSFFSRYHRDDVRCNIIPDGHGGIFCYELTRLPM